LSTDTRHSLRVLTLVQPLQQGYNSNNAIGQPRSSPSRAPSSAATPSGPWRLQRPAVWTRSKIAGPNPYQQRRLADQHGVFQAHQLHIRVAR
jgi:hypothetical protein